MPAGHRFADRGDIVGKDDDIGVLVVPRCGPCPRRPAAAMCQRARTPSSKPAI
jgi:hypothetical protein